VTAVAGDKDDRQLWARGSQREWEHDGRFDVDGSGRGKGEVGPGGLEKREPNSRSTTIRPETLVEPRPDQPKLPILRVL